MEHIALSERLERVTRFIPKQSRLADIGSDHAYLPVYAFLKKQITFAIAGEVNEGPFRSAQRTVNTYGLNDKIDVRLGNGLEVIKENEINTIIIAGMGGSLIQSILQNGSDKLTPDLTLILQPNIGAYGLRKWLTTHRWQIVDEDILEEDGHIYEIMVARHSDEPLSLKKEQLLMGPYLLNRKNDPVFQQKWKADAEKIKKILEDLKKSDPSESTQIKKRAFEEQLLSIERILK